MIKLFLLPLILHVLMTLWVGLRSFRARVKALKNGSAKLDVIEAESGEWPKRVRLNPARNVFNVRGESTQRCSAVTN